MLHSCITDLSLIRQKMSDTRLQNASLQTRPAVLLLAHHARAPYKNKKFKPMRLFTQMKILYSAILLACNWHLTDCTRIVALGTPQPD